MTSTYQHDLTAFISARVPPIGGDLRTFLVETARDAWMMVDQLDPGGGILPESVEVWMSSDSIYRLRLRGAFLVVLIDREDNDSYRVTVNTHGESIVRGNLSWLVLVPEVRGA